MTGGSEYLWSTAANWTNGIPDAGAFVTFNVSGPNNPSGYDDIANLMLDSMAVINGFAAVGSTLEIGAASFGSTVASVFSDTDLGSTGALLTIDGFTGSTDGRVGAFGVNAFTLVNSATDPGEIYQVDEGGELVLAATPHGNPWAGQCRVLLPELAWLRRAAQRHLRLPRSRRPPSVALPSNAAIGDAIALPGSDVASVTFGASSIAVVTNLGTTTFSDVTYLAGAQPTGYVASTDHTGLERITFASPQGVAFQQAITTGGEYLWSNAANWTNGAPPDVGAAVTFDVSGRQQPRAATTTSPT